MLFHVMLEMSLGELMKPIHRFLLGWMAFALLLPTTVPRLESHAFFPNSHLLAYCQAGHARAASQKKHIGKINLSKQKHREAIIFGQYYSKNTVRMHFQM
jgi:hypothetical protein